MMGTPSLFPLLLLIVALTTLPATKSEPDPVAYVIESEVKLLEDSNFVGDHFLFQKVDRVNKLTIYSNPGISPDKPGAEVFYRHESDSDKDIVVLADNEDFLKSTGKQNVFVVLRRVSKEEKNYVVFYAYIR